MFTPSWLSKESLKEKLVNQPWRWQLSQTIRVLENASIPFRLVGDPIYRYPYAELTDAKKVSSGWQFSIASHGLTGYHGTLPYAYQDADKDQRLLYEKTCFSDLMDILQQHSLTFPAKITNSISLPFRYEQGVKYNQPLANAILNLLGTSRPTYYVPAENLVRYAIALNQPDNIDRLSHILKDYFKLDIQIKKRSLARFPIPQETQTRLQCHVGCFSSSPGYLGQNAVIGNSCYLISSRVKVAIKVSSTDQYEALLSDKKLAPAIIEICSLYSPPGTKFCLKIECQRRLLPSPRLDIKLRTSSARLGLQSCLKGQTNQDTWVTTNYPITKT
ncbi:MAG: type VI secretion system baseplate subunit TssG [Endozoicomonas sp. (ex Botrylloides leachii)]|nr:type VI secretion system baseplate subunit TssG [Endozoicomonas sp. (ex Botrylloides leachii)]